MACVSLLTRHCMLRAAGVCRLATVRRCEGGGSTAARASTLFCYSSNPEHDFENSFRPEPQKGARLASEMICLET